MSRVKLSSITALTLHRSRSTTSRRTSPVPQLTCVGAACSRFQPDIVQCTPVGSSGGTDIEWRCEADLPSSLSFGSVEVSCEGWDGPSDPYVLKGSCGLTYNLVGSTARFDDDLDRRYSSQAKGGFSIQTAITSALLLYALYILLKSFLSHRPSLAARIPPPLRSFFGGGPGGGGGGGWGGGGGGGRPSNPPPPYSKTNPAPPASAPYQPGFWSGLAAGAAALYAANTLQNRNRQPQFGGRGGGYGGYRDDDRGVGGSGSWGGGGGGGGGGGMGPMRTSTGFGGTRNR